MNSNMNPNTNLICIIARGLLITALVLSMLFSLASRSTATTREIPLRGDTDILKQCAFEFWQQVNAARQDPLAAAARLEVPEHIVRQTFATQPWILEQGLPPLAWNQALYASATAHGHDMFSRVYYSYVSPEGSTYWERMEDAGYAPVEAGETMLGLFFENFIPLERGFEMIMNAVLRDELTGHPSVERNIFNPDFVEMGVSFFAESVPLLGDQPYVYMFLADFARPREVRSYVIGSYPLDSSVLMHPLRTGGWFPVRAELNPEQLPAGMFQVELPYGGADFVLVSNYGLGAAVDSATIVEPYTDPYAPAAPVNTIPVNATIDLRPAAAQEQP